MELLILRSKREVQHTKAVFSMYTGDYLSSDTKIFMNIDEVNYLSNQVIEGTLNGPVPRAFYRGEIHF